MGIRHQNVIYTVVDIVRYMATIHAHLQNVSRLLMINVLSGLGYILLLYYILRYCYCDTYYIVLRKTNASVTLLYIYTRLVNMLIGMKVKLTAQLGRVYTISIKQKSTNCGRMNR